MHNSRLGGPIIDCESDDLATAATFSTRAPGRAAVARDKIFIPRRDARGGRGFDAGEILRW